MNKLEGTENVKYEVKGNKLTLEINLKHRGQTTPKGNTRISSTLGNREIPETGGAMIGLNIYTKGK